MSSRRWRASSSVSWPAFRDRKSTRLNSSHLVISYAVFCLKKKKESQVKIDQRFANIDVRLDKMDSRLRNMDEHFDKVYGAINRLSAMISRIPSHLSFINV